MDAVLDSDRAGVERVLDYLQREREPLRRCRLGRLTGDPEVLGQETLRAPISACLQRIQGRLADALTEAQRAGELDRSLDPAALAAAVAAVVQAGYVLARAEQDPAAFQRAIDGARQLLTHTQTRKPRPGGAQQ